MAPKSDSQSSNLSVQVVSDSAQECEIDFGQEKEK